jgi:L-ascorbate metabolism protein UlaG (beta-lactamase superfamily)
MNEKNISFTWLGFGGFYIVTPNNMNILIDPWIRNNPICPEFVHHLEKIDYIFYTHAHRDHSEDAVWLSKQQKGGTVVAGWELSQILMRKGVDDVLAINKGGTRRFDGFSVTAVHADHSSAFVDGDQLLYGGEAMGYVFKFENDLVVYHAGDTNVFGDMALIAELYKPDVALLPIGDVYTMSPFEAAKAVRLLQVKKVIPTHFGGFDFLTGRPHDLAALLTDLKDVIIYDVHPGEAVEVGKSNL